MDNMNNNIQYPDLYNRLMPKVRECVNIYLYNTPMNSAPTQEQLDSMVNDVYEKMLEECPEIAEDPAERRRGIRNVSSQNRPFYGRRRLLRDITAILLLRELFGRRYPYYSYPRYGYPGYGPGFGYGPRYGY